MATVIHHSPHKRRTREAAFFHALQRAFPRSTHTPDSYALDAFLLDHLVDTKELASALEQDLLLPIAKRARLISELKQLPTKVRIALSASQVSCDFVVVTASQSFFVEFHEEQHRTLSVERAAPVYTSDGARRDVPRYVQRFLRDVWRAQAIPNFSIFWSDWFSSRDGAAVKLSRGFMELSESGRFSFSKLLSGPNKPLHATALRNAARER